MTQPSNYGTTPYGGIDPTVYYVVSASLTPETPAPPFAIGNMVMANNGSEFIFVQASTSISLGDFVAVTNALQANSMTSTNILSSLGARIGMAAAVLRQSVTYIPAGAYFWAQLRGSNCSGNSGSAVTAQLGAGNVQLFTSATAGAVTSVTTSSTLAAGLAGIECISSVTPLFNLSWPRTEVVYSSAGGTLVAQANV